MKLEILKEINRIPVNTLLEIIEVEDDYYIEYGNKKYSKSWIKLLIESKHARKVKDKQKCDAK